MLEEKRCLSIIVASHLENKKRANYPQRFFEKKISITTLISDIEIV